MKKLSAFLAMLFMVTLVSVPSDLKAADKPERVTATVVVASNEGGDYDLDNDAYRDQMIQLFSYSSYHQLEQYPTDLLKSERSKIELPEGYELILTLQNVEKGRILVQAVIRKGNQQYLDTVVSILKPGVVFLGGPPVSKGVLIIVLETRF